MSFVIGDFEYEGYNYVAQPFGYDETQTTQGLTARKVRLSVLLTAEEWAGLLGEYDAWRDIRINEPDSKTANDIGTTVAVSLEANGVEWDGVECWFLQAPVGEQIGGYVQATTELVDAEQALQALIKQDALAKSKYYFGTYELGGVTLNLLRPAETYQDNPQLSLTASGNSYIQGPLLATRVLQLEGDTDAEGWQDILEWYEGAVSSRPITGDWFPVSVPTASAEADLVEGARVDTYTVSISIGQVY